MARSIRANVVSRYLTTRGFTRSTSSASRVKGFPIYSSGFKVTSYDGRTFVEYNLGSRNAYMKEERRKEVVEEQLREITAVLTDAYEVIDLGERSVTRKLEITPKQG